MAKTTAARKTKTKKPPPKPAPTVYYDTVGEIKADADGHILLDLTSPAGDIRIALTNDQFTVLGLYAAANQVMRNYHGAGAKPDVKGKPLDVVAADVGPAGELHLTLGDKANHVLADITASEKGYALLATAVEEGYRRHQEAGKRAARGE